MLTKLPESDSLLEKRFSVDDKAKTIIEILTESYHNTSEDPLILRMTLKDETKFLKLSLGHLILNQEEYRVATFEDETESKSLQ